MHYSETTHQGELNFIPSNKDPNLNRVSCKTKGMHSLQKVKNMAIIFQKPNSLKKNKQKIVLGAGASEPKFSKYEIPHPY